ncbi:uncharacterized protein LOC119558817 isoform X1 [Drosophila subpulchrella]|uniref:uncharacterized protein LOC119558817 isoform X1 n=1 Tax=Drosophila subpulchrella TaxID=1486046 RepID=UPI0018A1341D|nr:uncharacterized protein LOC119558817 isoform X1 [Drosophila subpulchrella]
MFTMARIISSTTCTKLLYARKAPSHISMPHKKIWISLRKKNGLVFRNHSVLSTKNVIYKYPFKSHRRQFSDRLYEKGRGEELNYFLRLGREQFMKIRKNRIQEITNEIEQLEKEIQKLEKQTSHRSQKNKELLQKELQALREMLGRFHKNIEKETE